MRQLYLTKNTSELEGRRQLPVRFVLGHSESSVHKDVSVTFDSVKVLELLITPLSVAGDGEKENGIAR